MLFPGYHHAIDFRTASMKWAPVNPTTGKGSIWVLEQALDPLRDSVYEMTHGVAFVIANSERWLEGGLHPAMRDQLSQVYKGMAQASSASAELRGVFKKVYADALRRRETRGGHTLNV
jgi:hypothetical protein